MLVRELTIMPICEPVALGREEKSHLMSCNMLILLKTHVVQYIQMEKMPKNSPNYCLASSFNSKKEAINVL